MKKALFGLSLTILAAPLSAETGRYVLDPSHSQVLFQYEHLGYSTTWGLFSGFSGEIEFHPDDPAASSVTVSIPVMSMMTGWQERFETFMADGFFGATEQDMITFRSTHITITGENRADIAGDLSMNGITRPVVLDARLNQMGPHPIENRAWVGFDATATLIRSDFDLGQFAPFVGDEVKVQISIEAGKAE
ncbi:YceI family protein [Sedimentitalea sp. JM2-8]|uniref:YceI family protein n=1 Tax=Sedimentitalea xiamensis TaxID=3050037 RepID=A0ABT7FDM9_9RHOB|nr:YceI family protein [Sedimentitalea xiamensis]MDK3072929.1 YceI family protein [Sedimentitalea xiamensis]